VLANVKNIGKLLDKSREDERIVRLEKLDKLRERAEKLDVRVAELSARKENTKQWKRRQEATSDMEIVCSAWRGEKKEVARLQKLLTDVCVLEEELADVSDNDDTSSIEMEERKKIEISEQCLGPKRTQITAISYIWGSFLALTWFYRSKTRFIRWVYV
jgi:hypothetical protein